MVQAPGKYVFVNTNSLRNSFAYHYYYFNKQECSRFLPLLARL